MRPHAPWCERQLAGHSTCYRLVRTIEAAPGLRLLVELNRSTGVPVLISVAIDRGSTRSILPLSETAGDSLGAALTLAAQMAREV